MKITSKNLKGGLYGQLLLWCLELLPYLKENNINPSWDVKSEFYGTPSDYNIFGKYIIPNKEKCLEPHNSFDLFELKSNHGEKFFTNFKGDFSLANILFFDFFSFSDEITKEVTSVMDTYKDKKILGLHCRGTDKIGTEGGYIDINIFKRLVDDYLDYNKIDVIFIFSDEINISKTIEGYYDKKYLVKNFNDTESNTLLFNTYNNNLKSNDLLYKKTIVDSIVLSKCNAVIKTSSQFSAWAKIFNPKIEIYRVSAFKENWFPDFYIPLYKSENELIKKMLDAAFIDENKTQK